jgi:hypothetical protein
MLALVALTLGATPLDVVVLPENPVLAREVTSALGRRPVRNERLHGLRWASDAVLTAGERTFLRSQNDLGVPFLVVGMSAAL